MRVRGIGKQGKHSIEAYNNIYVMVRPKNKQYFEGNATSLDTMIFVSSFILRKRNICRILM